MTSRDVGRILENASEFTIYLKSGHHFVKTKLDKSIYDEAFLSKIKNVDSSIYDIEKFIDSISFKYVSGFGSNAKISTVVIGYDSIDFINYTKEK